MRTQTTFPHSNSRLQFAVPIGLALTLLILWAIGYGPNGSKCNISIESIASIENKYVTNETPIITTPAPPNNQKSEIPDALLAQEIPPIAKIFFAENSSKVTDEDLKSINQIFAYLETNPNAKVNLTGFYNSKDKSLSELESTKLRAKNVMAAMQNLGIEPESFVLNTPKPAGENEDVAQIRRVEIAIVQ